ncbi:hypothetical protein AAG906_004930 [Vitis piasezkii]
MAMELKEALTVMAYSRPSGAYKIILADGQLVRATKDNEGGDRDNPEKVLDFIETMIYNPLCVWRGPSYAETTWEKDVDIAFAQDVIDEYKARKSCNCYPRKMVEMQRMKSKASSKKFDGEFGWLKGGRLRDYQFEGLNFLVKQLREDALRRILDSLVNEEKEISERQLWDYRVIVMAVYSGFRQR